MPNRESPALAGIHYGNEYIPEVQYQAAAILIDIPNWSFRSMRKGTDFEEKRIKLDE